VPGDDRRRARLEYPPSSRRGRRHRHGQDRAAGQADQATGPPARGAGCHPAPRRPGEA
jgi:hypothetical protein